MKVLAFNAGHDGAVVSIEHERLMFSIENEKDDQQRYSATTPSLFLRGLQIEEIPDVVAIAGWVAERAPDKVSARKIEAGYFDEGVSGKIHGETLFAGRRVKRFSSSHVRSHIFCTYGLSPFPQGQPCYVLVWEGLLGGMYHVDANVSIRKLGDVLPEPGDKYSLLYALADPTRRGRWFRFDDAGKLMALAAFGTPREPTSLERQTIEKVMGLEHCTAVDIKTVFKESPYCNIGVESQELKDLAWQFSRALFDRFYQFAKQHVEPGHPLLIVGGCGLNCDWNSQWRECGLFSDTFVPPCTNDTGVAIGAGIDALHHYTGQAKIDWNVYAGDPFVDDMVPPAPDFVGSPLNLRAVCEGLRRGDVIAWVQGRYEMGPRALGNRSMLASPFSTETRDKLNRIKQRDSYRPIAPICLLEEFEQHFESRGGASPHMLYFQNVKNPQLAGVTHVDGSARAQSVSDAQNPEMAALLRMFGEVTGVPVLCNTSLNFKGRGFVNRLSQLCELVRHRGLDGMVVGDRYWRCGSH